MTTKTLGFLTSLALAALMGQPAQQAFAANDNADPDPKPQRPPQEAFDACTNKEEGATCTVSFHGKTLEGKCHKGPLENSPLACMPPPPRHHRQGVAACANQTEGTTCTLSLHGQSVQGTCLKGPSAETLACVPPPPPAAVEACANLSEGFACTVSFHGKSLAGKCHKGPSGSGTLACRPTHLPRD